MPVVIILVSACALGVFCILVQSVVLLRFLHQTPRISDDADLESFRRIARLAMWLTIAAIPVMLVMIVSSIAACLLLGVKGLVLVLALNAVSFVIAKIGKSIEVRARSLDAATVELEDAYQRIGECWTKKLFPDF